MENSVQPTGIEVSNNDQVLEIEWSDGVKSQQVGNHAIQITWADGHNSGMYRWETLRFLDPENHK